MTRDEAIEFFKSIIEAKAQLKANGFNNEYGFRVGNNFFDALDLAIKALEQKYIIYEDGRIEPLEKTGHWIYTGDFLTEGMLKCSSCGYEHDVADRFLYCPKCGAKMESEEE